MAQETNLKAQKLLVFGVTGLIGSRILKALIAAGSSFECISAFVSPGSLEKKRDLIESLKSRGIKVIIGDVNSDDDVRAAYQGVDTVISALGRDVLASQIRLIQLAASPSSSVKWFFPSEYGTDIEYSPASVHERPHQQKLKVRAALREVGDRLVHTYVVTGPFAELYLDRGMPDLRGGAFRVKERTADLLGDGNDRVSLTTMDDVGKLVVAALLHPSASRNRALKVNSFTTTPAEILSEFERQTGGQKWEHVTYTPLDELRRFESEAWKDGPSGRATVLTLRRIWTEGGTLYEKRDNEVIDAPPMETLEDVVKKVIEIQSD